MNNQLHKIIIIEFSKASKQAEKRARATPNPFKSGLPNTQYIEHGCSNQVTKRKNIHSIAIVI